MTNEEYLKIINNPKATLELPQLYLMLREIHRDATEELMYDRNNTLEKQRWLCGMINGLDIAINLIEHLKRR